MPGSRTATAVVGLVVGLAVSAAAWVAFDSLVLFLFVPFVPFLFRRGDRERPPRRTCPTCGFATRDPEYEHCPRDGRRLRLEDDD